MNKDDNIIYEKDKNFIHNIYGGNVVFDFDSSYSKFDFDSSYRRCNMKKETYKELYWLMDKLTDINYEIEDNLFKINELISDINKKQEENIELINKLSSYLGEDDDE